MFAQPFTDFNQTLLTAVAKVYHKTFQIPIQLQRTSIAKTLRQAIYDHLFMAGPLIAVPVSHISWRAICISIAARRSSVVPTVLFTR